jgi:hypothetical protein
MIALGTVMEIEKNRALVFTMDGGVVYIRPRLGLFVGQQVTFAKKELLTARRKLLAALPYAALTAAALAVALVTAGLFGAFGRFGAPVPETACAAYIALDINPSVQFSIDEEGTVLSVKAMNGDGRTLLSGLDLVGLPVREAVSGAIAKARELGFIEDERSVVLVAGTLNDGNGEVLGRRSEYRSKLQAILSGMGGNGGADVLALYIEDSSVKEKADGNGLSIGRELLREFAAQSNIALDDNDIRTGKVADLLDKMSDPKNCLPVVTAGPTSTAEAAEPTVTPSPTPTVTPTPKPQSPTPAQSSSAPNTPKPTDRPAPGVSCKLTADGFKISWPKAGPGKGSFVYYKIVFSIGNPSPKYPDDGYAKVVTDVNTTSATVKANSGYDGGDVGGKIRPGVTYYISVTYVYEKGYVYGNTVRAKCPTPPAATDPPSFSGTLNCSAEGDRLRLSWTKAPKEDGFCYYKVVFSKSNPHPKYPDDGYLFYFDSINKTSCYANAADGLDAGEEYYVSITYVYSEDGDTYYYYSSVKRVTVPGAPEATFESASEPADTPTEKS